MHDWIRRRQGTDREAVTLLRGRIYILPTGLGVAFGVMLLAMLLGSLNYGNNLGLGLAFLLVSLGLVVMHHCHGTLSGLALRLAATESAFVGGEARFRYTLENTALAPRPRIELGVGREPGCVVDVPAAGSATGELRLPASHRIRRIGLMNRLGFHPAPRRCASPFRPCGWPRRCPCSPGR